MSVISFDPRTIKLSGDALTGRVIAITGPTSGIGQALALECAQRGAQLLLLGRNAIKLDNLYTKIKTLRTYNDTEVFPPVLAPIDLEKAVAGDYDSIAEAIEVRFGHLDGLVHNAAILGQLTPIEQYDVPMWLRVMHVNVTSAFALTQVLLPSLRASKDSSVICTTSSVGRQGRAYWGAYAISKFAIEGFVQVLAAELENTSVRINALNPGRARTAMRRQAFPSEDLAALPTPESLTHAYVALLSAQARGVTGGSFDAQ